MRLAEGTSPEGISPFLKLELVTIASKRWGVKRCRVSHKGNIITLRVHLRFWARPFINGYRDSIYLELIKVCPVAVVLEIIRTNIKEH